MATRIGSKLFFQPPIWTSHPQVSQIEFSPFLEKIYIKLAPEVKKEYDIVAGSLGLGSEFFSDIQGVLCEMDLELLPFTHIDVPPIDLLHSVIKILKARSKPGNLIFKSYRIAPICPYDIWLLKLFGTAILSFKDVTLEPLDQFVQQLETTEVVEVGQDVTIGIDQNSGELRLIMVENFQQRQLLNNLVFTQQTCGIIMEILNQIEMKYYEFPELEEFDFLAARMLSQAQESELFNELILKDLQYLVNLYHNQLDYEIKLWQAGNEQ